jgi:predicted aspartyl protease
MPTLKILISAAVIMLACSGLIAAQQSPVADVPMLFSGTMPAVEVMINGKGKFLFAIDTGAQGMARVDSSLVERLGLQTVGKVQAGDPSGQNTQTLDVVHLDTISIGNVQFHNVEALSRNYNQSTRLSHIDGILGFDLFSAYLLTLDFQAKRVRLESGELPKPDGAEILNFESPNGIPVVDLNVGDRKIKAHIDSGNMVGGFVLPASIVEKLSLASQPVIVGRARTISSEVEIKEVRLKDSLRLGRYDFTDPKVTFPAISEYANIGSKILVDFALTFDQKNHRLRITRKINAGQNAAQTDSSNLKDYVGKYGENKMITVEGNELRYQRIGGRGGSLVALSKDRFKLNDDAQLTFIRDAKGNITELLIEWNDGTKERLKRVP